ncbi:hypothetical protein ACFLWX_04640 [Chloroflexota bacterium]
MEEIERQKLKVLLGRWIEHNREHGEEFREWAMKAGSGGEARVQVYMMRAAQEMDQASKSLLDALHKLKG